MHKPPSQVADFRVAYIYLDTVNFADASLGVPALALLIEKRLTAEYVVRRFFGVIPTGLLVLLRI